MYILKRLLPFVCGVYAILAVAQLWVWGLDGPRHLVAHYVTFDPEVILTIEIYSRSVFRQFQ